MKELLRFAHIEGYTDVAFSDDGKNIITCGSDGDYRVWNGFEDDDPVCVRVGDEATCIAFKKGKIYVGTDMHALQIFSAADNEPDGLVWRFTANVTHAHVDADGQRIAAGSCDMSVRVKELQPAGRDFSFEGHTAPILSVHLDPRSEFLASSSCDGTVRVWSLKTRKELVNWPWAPRSNDFSNAETLCRLQFEPTTGRCLAVPCAGDSTGCVRIVERATWKVLAELKDDRVAQVSVCCWSPCGKYLATAGCGGHIVVWNVASQRVVKYFLHQKSAHICSLAWNPSRTVQQVAFCDSRGYLGLLEDATKDGQATPSDTTTGSDWSANAAGDGAVSGRGDVDDHDDNSTDISITQIKKASGFDVDQVNGVDVFTGVRPSTLDIDSVVDDMASRGGSPAPPASRLRSPAPAAAPLQEAFQPGSTPVHLRHRYMVWNSVGIVRCFEDDSAAGSDVPSIEVEFHDTSVHHALHIANSAGHTMAALSAEALLLASPATASSDAGGGGGGGGGSRIVCVHLASWDGNKEWTTQLPDGEQAMAVALGAGWAAVATSRHLLRFFTTAGVQRAAVALPGAALCLAGHGRHLLVAFHCGAAPAYGLLDVEPTSAVGYRWRGHGQQPLPLAAGRAQLAWAGFSDEGQAAFMDTTGLVQVLVEGVWMPVLDTKQHVKGPSDHHFLIGLSQVEQSVRSVLCKGARYPPTLPRPSLSLLPFQVPLCDAGNDKSRLEETLVRASMLVDAAPRLQNLGLVDVADAADQAVRSFKESLMKMFALACQSDREARAVDVARWMNDEQLLQLAVKYATRARKRHLADRLTRLAEQLLQQQDDVEDELEPQQQQQQQFSSTPLQQRRPASSSSFNCNSQQDMFASSEEAPAPDVGDNPLLLAKQQQQRRLAAAAAGGVDSPAGVDGAAKTIRPASQAKKNPFAKKSSQSTDAQGATPPAARGVAVFDEPSNQRSQSASKENAAGRPKNASKQPTLLRSLQKKSTPSSSPSTAPLAETTPTDPAPQSQPKSGFMLWLEENKPALAAQHPAASESELTRMAAQRFRALPEEQRLHFGRKRKASDDAAQSPAHKLAAFAATEDSDH